MGEIKMVEIDHFKITAQCPFCHSRKAKLVSKKAPCGYNGLDDVVFRQRSYVRCMKCDARGPLASARIMFVNYELPKWATEPWKINKEAVEKWNAIERSNTCD